jgi:amidophosphoribosyltransferase
MAERKQLIAAQRSVEEICRHIGADSLGYLSLEGLLRAAQPPAKAGTDPEKSGFCHACFSGEYPIAVPKDVQVTKLALEETVTTDWGRRSAVVEPLPARAALAKARD